MATTHLCIKSFYVEITGEGCPIVSKTYIIPLLSNDLLSVKSLNRQ